ncbi:hypothetical protein C3K47_00245 [Solitalea longa]|uniref:DoxX family protein n=1 Tax=Solitalea longa TaxID=2079460 RepID=A0A2S5A9X3_9SPHI|nr:hypothetical protein [Solitalea longa]POY39390.1 hypothetical protein C3K47_00245 [Solitalea longa]
MAHNNTHETEWKGYEKAIFQISFIYFLIQSVPLDWKYYKTVFSIQWSQLNYHDLINITRYYPQFITPSAPEFGYVNWLIVLGIAAIVAAIWTFRNKERTDYDTLYYWLRVVLRYRLAFGVIGYGIIKLFPVQLPGPTLSDLNTPYGDYFTWKIFALTTGISTAWYESFLGLIEIVGGLLLLNRKTVTIGAGLLAAFLVNVVIVNFAYDIGDQVYSSYLLLIALALLVYDTPRLFQLLVLGKKTIANKFHIVFTNQQKSIRTVLRTAFLLFTLLFVGVTGYNYNKDAYIYPKTPGLKNAYGYYNVKEFSINGKPIPYSLTDPQRWQNVVFEKWATISVRTSRPLNVNISNGTSSSQDDIDRKYELAGAGGRNYFNYGIDSVNQVLKLQNKNSTAENWSLHYERPDEKTIILSGKNEKQDSVYIVLDKINKQYLQLKGRRKPLTL